MYDSPFQIEDVEKGTEVRRGLDGKREDDSYGSRSHTA